MRPPSPSTRRTPRSRRVTLAGVAVALAGLVGWFVVGQLHLAGAEEIPVSQGKPVTASSQEGLAFAAMAAVDGNSKTRWSSAFADPQWIQIDLGAPVTVDRVVLNWERAAGRAYQIQVSPDAKIWTTAFQTTTGAEGIATHAVHATGRYVRMLGTARTTAYGFSLFEFQVFGSTGAQPTTSAPSPAVPSSAAPVSSSAAPTTSASSGDGWIMAPNPVTNVTPSHTVPPDKGGFHEFQANCTVSRTNLQDDPIVFPGLPGASHFHTFMGNTTTNAASTIESLSAGQTTCAAKGDLSAYWMPTLYNGDTAVNPVGKMTIYYKSGVGDYTSVRSFPKGLRFVVGNAKNTDATAFRNATEAGWECDRTDGSGNFPAFCTAAGNIQLNIRYQAPSCWDGIHLDSPDHQSHMAYPIDSGERVGKVCPADHPVAVPKLEFKMAWPVNGDMSKVHFASGAGPTFHYDFMNAWDPATLTAMVNGCIVAARQCDAQGHDGRDDQQPAPYVLNSNYVLP
jgi:Domain of unknown function (DUF1996)/F5/8 type C domain